jgi:hypothetical protein
MDGGRGDATGTLLGDGLIMLVGIAVGGPAILLLATLFAGGI